MKKTLFIVLGAILLTSSSFVYAAGYGAAGCGLGSLLTTKNDKTTQVLVWFVNNALFPQSSAVTSGTSNCVPAGAVVADKQQENFVEQNHVTLSKEMAMGHGESLDTLAGLLGCQTESHKNFGSILQSNYEKIITTEDIPAAQMLHGIKSILKQDSQMQKSCSNIMS